ncbi:MAG: WD40 repeat domain-containing protein [Treponema sp.]|nr:WD40 repeat domain-containing protein [Treponema sp.]
MAKAKKKHWIILGFFIFVVYVFIAPQPIPVETILVPRWLSSLESDYSALMSTENNPPQDYLVPFTLGNRFGYVDTHGQFTINQPVKGVVSLSEDRWAEFEAAPETIHIRSPQGESLTVIEKDRGYPLFLDGKIFLIGENQTSLSLADDRGEILWTYDFAAPLTSIDANSDLILTGSLDGVVELLNSSGKRIYSFSPGGSRLAVILGCRISKDGSRLAIISGYDDQRFLVLERFGDSYRVVYHEFLDDGFRHAVHISFIANDSWIVFERQGGLGLYELEGRRSIMVPLSGTIKALDETGDNGLIFVINSLGGQSKSLAAIRLPGVIIMEAAFQSENAFFSRRGSEIYVGGGMTLASFELETR